MADQELPTEYDAIVLGTGMTESIVAAALSRIGWKVLHLDRNDYYSGDWASFHFKGLQEWIEKATCADPELLKPKLEDVSGLLGEGEKAIPLTVLSSTIKDVQETVHVCDKLQEEIEAEENAKLNSAKDSTNTSKASQEITPGTEAVQGGASAVEASKQDTSNEHASEEGASVAEASQEVAPATESTDTEQKSEEQQTAGGDANSTENQPGGAESAEDTATVEAAEEEIRKPKQWSITGIKNAWRKFSIDLSPRILYCRGPMVELLISSDIAKYCEFRTITRVLTQINGNLEKVPCSRADVFSSKQVSMIEKRMLMKLLTSCLEYEQHPEEYQDYIDRPFLEYLQSKKVSDTVKHYVQHAIAMATEKTSTLEGLKATQKFLSSLGRYGNTAFLWPLYGSGELPQCFCRVCAVFGGIYCLRRDAVALTVDKDNKCTGIVDTEGQKLTARHVILEASYASTQLVPQLSEPQPGISRAVLFTDRSVLLDGNTEHITLLSLPPGDDQESRTTVFELASISLACPKDIYVVYLSCRRVNGAEADLKHVVEKYFRPADRDVVDEEEEVDSKKPKILWSLYYTQDDTSDLNQVPVDIENLYVVGGPDMDLDFDISIEKAKQIFDVLCPGEEFLPKAPNPEDIIFDDGAEAGTEGSGFESEQRGSEGGTAEQSQTETAGGKVEEPAEQNQTEGEDKEAEKPVSQTEES